MKKTILYCGVGSASNIGNAFVDYGVWGLFKHAVPKMRLITTSNMPFWIYNRYYSFFKTILPENFFVKNSPFDIRNLIETDYYCLGGAFLTKELIDFNYKFIKFLIETKSKVILCGISGGNDYSKEQILYVQDILKQLNVVCFISRDNKTYEYYKNFAGKAYNGVDNAFFMPEYFEPAKLKNKAGYDVFTFDDVNEQDIKTKRQIIRLQHDFWHAGRIKHALKYRKNIVRHNDLLSDWAEDYLNIYANCHTTYSDRVHACVATLIYGNKARYFGHSPRSYLFDRVKLNQINHEVVSLDFDYINSEKKQEIKFLQEFFEKEIE